MPVATPIKGVNDLCTLFPDVAEEWHPTKNGNLLPSDFKPGSKHVAWWKGKCGHEWQVAIYSRTKNGKSGCPICSNLVVLAGFNDLATTNPSLAAEWHPDKNGDLRPTDVTAGSMKYVWWKCKQGHEWRALIRNRNQGYGCPTCKTYTQTSFPEQCIFYYLKREFPDAINRYSDMFDDLMEVDVYIPSIKVAIEYDGNWHAGKDAEKREKKKYEICKRNGVLLYRIRENLLDVSNACDYQFKLNRRATGESLDELIYRLGLKLGVEIICDSKRDAVFIQEAYRQDLESQSLLVTRPEIAREWHPTKNGQLKPSMFRPFSTVKVWWMCSLGHEWEATISQRGKGYGCPYCGGKEVLKGFNDLQTKYPQIALEWHPLKNSNLKPDSVSFGSSKKVWWLCPKGHEYEARIDGRTSGRGCPYCAGKRLLVGYNDLATTNPKLASEWHPDKNGKLSPSDVFEGGRQAVWWRCQQGHEWKAQISSRVRSGCPYCGNKKINAGFNDLETTYPEIAKEWHPVLNEKLTPMDVSAGSRAKVWWVCKNGHEYQMAVSRRKLGYGCPYCSGQKVLPGFNDLATINPKIAIEWNQKLNGNLTPQEITAGSAKKVWWTCPKGHEYQMIVNRRNLGSGCPYCSNHRLLSGFNDLATVNPSLASEWHPTKNGDLRPTAVMSCTDKVVWWKCALGHEWKASIAHRKYSPNCPICRKNEKT